MPRLAQFMGTVSQVMGKVFPVMGSPDKVMARSEKVMGFLAGPSLVPAPGRCPLPSIPRGVPDAQGFFGHPGSKDLPDMPGGIRTSSGWVWIVV